MSQETSHMLGDALKDAPILAPAGLTIFGVPLPDIVLILTGIYTLMRIYAFIKDRWVDGKEDDDA